jgi:hypothetical protein
MSAVWSTKWGPRRVRQSPPTLEEAFVAADSLTDDFSQKIEIAASLMGVAVEEARAQASKFSALANARSNVVNGRGRAVVVQIKRARISRPGAPAPRR